MSFQNPTGTTVSVASIIGQGATSPSTFVPIAFSPSFSELNYVPANLVNNTATVGVNSIGMNNTNNNNNYTRVVSTTTSPSAQTMVMTNGNQLQDRINYNINNSTAYRSALPQSFTPFTSQQQQNYNTLNINSRDSFNPMTLSAPLISMVPQQLHSSTGYNNNNNNQVSYQVASIRGEGSRKGDGANTDRSSSFSLKKEGLNLLFLSSGQNVGEEDGVALGGGYGQKKNQNIRLTQSSVNIPEYKPYFYDSRDSNTPSQKTELNINQDSLNLNSMSMSAYVPRSSHVVLLSQPTTGVQSVIEVVQQSPSISREQNVNNNATTTSANNTIHNYEAVSEESPETVKRTKKQVDSLENQQQELREKEKKKLINLYRNDGEENKHVVSTKVDEKDTKEKKQIKNEIPNNNQVILSKEGKYTTVKQRIEDADHNHSYEAVPAVDTAAGDGVSVINGVTVTSNQNSNTEESIQSIKKQTSRKCASCSSPDKSCNNSILAESPQSKRTTPLPSQNSTKSNIQYDKLVKVQAATAVHTQQNKISGISNPSKSANVIAASLGSISTDRNKTEADDRENISNGQSNIAVQDSKINEQKGAKAGEMAAILEQRKRLLYQEINEISEQIKKLKFQEKMTQQQDNYVKQNYSSRGPSPAGNRVKKVQMQDSQVTASTNVTVKPRIKTGHSRFNSMIELKNVSQLSNIQPFRKKEEGAAVVAEKDKEDERNAKQQKAQDASKTTTNGKDKLTSSQFKTRSEYLYQIAILQSQKKREQQEQLRSQQSNREQAQCTFSPKIISKKKASQQGTFQERQAKFQTRVETRRSELRTSCSNEREQECTFKPEINKSKTSFIKQNESSVAGSHYVEQFKKSIDKLKTKREQSVFSNSSNSPSRMMHEDSTKRTDESKGQSGGGRLQLDSENSPIRHNSSKNNSRQHRRFNSFLSPAANASAATKASKKNVNDSYVTKGQLYRHPSTTTAAANSIQLQNTNYTTSVTGNGVQSQYVGIEKELQDYRKAVAKLQLQQKQVQPQFQQQQHLGTAITTNLAQKHD